MSEKLPPALVVTVALVLLVVAAVPAAAAPPKTVAPPVRASGPAPTATPTPSSQPGGYTQQVDCPTTEMHVQIDPATLPAGWHTGWEKLVLRKANLEEQPSKQVLWCSYVRGGGGFNETFDVRSNTMPPRGSCIANPLKPGFLCRPGTIN